MDEAEILFEQFQKLTEQQKAKFIQLILAELEQKKRRDKMISS